MEGGWGLLLQSLHPLLILIMTLPPLLMPPLPPPRPRPQPPPPLKE